MEDAGIFGLGVFFEHSDGETGGGGTGGGPQWDGDAARRWRHAKELAKQRFFVGEFAGRVQCQTVGNAPSTHHEASTAMPLDYCTAHSEPQPPAASLSPSPPHPSLPPSTFYALPPLHTAAAVVSNDRPTTWKWSPSWRSRVLACLCCFATILLKLVAELICILKRVLYGGNRCRVTQK